MCMYAFIYVSIHVCISMDACVYSVFFMFVYFRFSGQIIEKVVSTCNKTKMNITVCSEVYKIGDGLESKSKAKFLGVIVFAVAVGIVAGRMKERAAVFVQFLSIFNDIITKLIIVAMW